jgi:hypothetical protein
MSGSAPEGKATIRGWLAELAPICAVDVGAGNGVYQRMLAELVPDCRVVGIEVWWPNVDGHTLRDRYAEVVVADVVWLDWHRVMALYHPDLAIFGDVIEHLSRADAERAVHAVTGRSIDTIISVPVVEWPQGAVDGNPYDRHVETWTHDQVMDTFRPTRSVVDGPIGVYLIEARR